MGIASHQISFRRFVGAEIESAVEGLAALRIAVFRDYPYLYDGDFDYEKEYLKVYLQSERSFLFAAFDDDKMVGATTCIPLVDESDEVQAPFREQNIDLASVFYFGESILLKPYRGQGWGKRFFEEREKHAFQYPEIKKVVFCGVRRPVSHPMRPNDFLPLDPFWISRGYQKDTRLVSYFDWKDIGDEESTSKPMDYWYKNR